jgi:aldehyde dehydrogenase (NAD+)
MHNYDTAFIDGRWVASQASDTIDVVNPATEAVIGRIPAAGAEDVDLAVRAAQAARHSWARATVGERAAVLRRFSDSLARRRTQLADLLVLEAGIPHGLAHGHHVDFPIEDIARMATLVESHVMEQRVGNSLIIREPVGVVAALAPWNFPLLLAVNKLAPALAAGCTVVLKPSEQTPLHAYVLMEAAEEAGLPAGVLNLVTGTGPVTGEALASHPGVDMVSLTGSTRAGQRVSELASKTLKRTHLELGGKSASIILDDADLDAAVSHAVGQCFWNSGQNCIAWSRMLVPQHLHDDIAERAAAAAAGYRLGDPSDPGTAMGPLISAAQADRVRGFIQGGEDEGATLVHGAATRPAEFDRGYYVQPSVFAGANNGMRIAREEIFGPVLAILPYATEAEAISVANDSPYGLHGGVFSADQARALSVAREMQTGMVDINGAPINAYAPWGGVKLSGVGRELGVFGLDEYFELKAVQF